MLHLRFHVLNIGAELVGLSDLEACACNIAILLSALEPFIVERTTHGIRANFIRLLVRALGLSSFVV